MEDYKKLYIYNLILDTLYDTHYWCSDISSEDQVKYLESKALELLNQIIRAESEI